MASTNLVNSRDGRKDGDRQCTSSLEYGDRQRTSSLEYAVEGRGSVVGTDLVGSWQFK